MKLINFKYLFLILALFSAPSTVLAQQKSGDIHEFEFRGVPMNEVLDRLAYSMDLDLVYDPELVKKVTVYKRIKADEVNSMLQSLLHDHNLDFITLSSGTIVIVRSTLESPAKGIFSGKITDKTTGEPLHGANVMLADASGGTSTTASGNFSIPGLISGSHEIIISYLGYEPVFHSIYIPADDEVQEQISLAPKSLFISPIVVESHRPRLPGSSLSGMDSRDFNPTPIKNLNLMPGIQFGLPLRDLHMQGGQHGEHRVLLDGVPIYNPYSFGQMFSSFSPLAIGNIKLHKAGYGVSEGSQIAGLINMSHDLKMNNQNSAYMQADPLSVNVKGDLSIPVNDQRSVNIMSALRTNFWDTYQDRTLDRTLNNWDNIDPLIANLHLDEEVNATTYSQVMHESDVRFLDLHFAAKYKPDPFSSIETSFYLADNFLETNVLNETQAVSDMPRFLFAGDSYSWNNVAGQIKWNTLLTPRIDLSVQAGYSENRFEHKNLFGTGAVSPFISRNTEIALEASTPGEDGVFTTIRQLPTQIDGNQIQHAFLKSDTEISITRGYSISTGLQLDRIKSDVSISDTDFTEQNMQEASFMISGYLENNHTIGRYWNFKYGSRFTWLDQTNNIYAEPRASIQFDQPESSIGYWSVRVAGGLYRQFINEYRISNTGASSIVPHFSIWSHAGREQIPRAYHLTGSLYLEPASQTSITLEAYYKHQPNAAITSYTNFIENRQDSNNPEVFAFADNRKLEIAGGGIRIDQALAGSRIRLNAGYDYSYTLIDLNNQFGKSLSAPWNDPHRVQFRTFYYLFEQLAFVVKWQGIWGRTWAYRDSYYNFLRISEFSRNGHLDFSDPENDTLSNFQQVDLSVVYSPAIGNAAFELRLELINILNRKNVLDRGMIPVYSSNEIISYNTSERKYPGFYPSISIQANF